MQSFASFFYVPFFTYFLFFIAPDKAPTPALAEGIGLPKLATTTMVGTIGGEFSVNGNGGATYYIPIDVPPGTNGVQPDLSLQYNSQAGNGLLGVGWSINGISSIKRIGQSPDRDGAKSGVNLNIQDRFAIDGQALVVYRDTTTGVYFTTPDLVKQNYGKSGKEYRTEIDSWARVFAQQQCGDGPCFFKVMSKDGSISEYGRTPDSRLEPNAKNNGVVLEWLVNKVTDRNGNYVTLEYVEDPQHQWYYPKAIYYTGNAKAGLAPQRAVFFEYEKREDQIPQYVGGSKILNPWRMTRISTYVDLDGDAQNVIDPKNLVKQYKINYTYSQTTALSLLSGIIECDAAGTCLPATTLTYGRDKNYDGTFRIVTPGKNQAGDVYQDSLRFDPGALIIPGDYNGDGRMDFLRQSQADWGNQIGSYPNFQAYLMHTDSTYQIWQPGAKINGDPYQDLLRYNGGANVLPGDFNGDGKTDFIRQEKGGFDEDYNLSFQVFFSTSPGKFNIVTPGQNAKGDVYQDNLRFDPGANLILGDYNGDGKTDFIRQEKGDWDNDDYEKSFQLYFSNGDGTFQIFTPGKEQKYDPYQDSLRYDPGAIIIPGDYNGDGKTDFIRQEKGGWGADSKTTFKVFFSNGDGTFQIVQPGTERNDDPYQGDLRLDPGAQLLPGDFNGDGKTDFIRQEHGGWASADYVKSFEVYFSKGDGTFEIVEPGKEVQNDPYQDDLKFDPGANIITGDYNGDNKTDFLRQERGNADGDLVHSFQVYLSKGDGTFRIFQPGKENTPQDPYQDWLRFDPGVNIIPSDINGDGTTDFIRQEKGGFDADINVSFQLYFSKPSAADLVTKITNGIGKQTAILYEPLTSGKVYITGSSEQSLVQIPLWVVSWHREIAGQDTFKYSHIYKYAKVDRIRGWMGFAETHLYDWQNNSLTITTHNLDFPLVGTISSRQVVNIKNGNNLGVVNIRYDHFRVPNTKIYRVFKNYYSISHYTESTFDYQLQKVFTYDALYKNVVSIQNIGDTGQPDDELYTYFKYPEDSREGPNSWKTFHPIAKKVSTSSTANLKSWDPKNDIEWETYAYDAHMNLVAENVFRDNNGGEGTDAKLNTWIRSAYRYDSLGNTTRTYLPGSSSRYIEHKYDTLYATFVKSTLSPGWVPKGYTKKLQLKTTAVYDPRFGVQIAETDFNGNKTFLVPDLGMDGLGRVLTTQGTHDTDNRTVTLSKIELKKETDGGTSIKTMARKDWGKDDPKTWLWYKTYHDLFGRNYKTESSAYRPGTTLVQKNEYDNRGLLDKEYFPYYADSQGVRYSPTDTDEQPLAYRQHFYDGYLRPQSIMLPDPNYLNKMKVAQIVHYNLRDDRQVTYSMPDPKQEDEFVRWLYKMDTYGRIVHKSGPYLDTDALIPVPGTDTTLYSYDIVGKLLQVIDPKGEKSSFTYNSLGELLTESKPETGLKKYTYNDQGLLVSEKDAKGQRIKYTYDTIGRVATKTTLNVTGRVQKRVQYDYDNLLVKNGLGRLTRISMLEGSYEFQYNNNGRVQEERVTITGSDVNKDKVADQFITRYVYDAQGRLLQITNPDQSIVSYSFSDYDGNLLTISERSGPGAQLDTLASYSNYNSNGVAEQAKYGNDVHSTWKYDVLGRMQTATMSKGNFEHQNLSYTWNRSNKLQSIQDRRSTRDEDLSQTFAYDQLGRLISASGVYGQETYAYDPAGNRTSDQTFSYQYNPKAKHQINQVLNPKNQAVVFSYTYDSNGNITQQDNPNPLPDYQAATDGVFKSSSTQYQYDEENRLVKVSVNNKVLNRFTYDENGIRLSKMEADSTLTYYVSSLYEVVRLPKGQFIHTRYVQGPEGILQARSKDGKSVTLLTAKDELGTILHRNKDNWNPWPLYFSFLQLLFFGSLFALLSWSIKGGVQHWLEKLRLYPLAEPTVVYGHTSIWMKTAQWLKRFSLGFLVWGFTMVSIIPLNAQQSSPPAGYPETGTVRYFHQDYLHSSTLLTDETGGQANRVNYKPFGGLDKNSTIGKNNFRAKFTGKELDDATGLYYFGARYYNAQQGRFISPDPAQQYHSPYLYGSDDPLSGVDPDGEFFVTLTLIIVGLIIGAYAGGAIANHDANPVNWDWKSGKTWAGIIVGGALGAAVGAFAGAGLAAAGVPVAASIGGVTATTIASTSIDVAFLAYDGYQFSQDRSAENGIYLALDMIPFVGALLGRGVKAIRGAAKAMTEASHEAEMVAHEGEESAHESETAESVCAMSFAEDTEVMTAEGEQSIQNIEVGDQVWAYNEQTDKMGLYPVSRIFQRIATTMLVIALANDTIAVTPEHPFFVEGKGWCDAALLQKGDQLLTKDESAAFILSMDTLVGQYRVYNFEVEEAHNYFVSEEGILVHNPKGCGKPGKGGPHGQTKKFSEQDLVESNHVPAAQSMIDGGINISRDKMGANTVPYKFHRLLKTTGSSKISKAFRAKQAAFIKANKFVKAMEMDIEDYRRVSKELKVASGVRQRIGEGLKGNINFYRKAKRLSAADEAFLLKLVAKL